jgi:hypothetical protein
MWQKWKVSYADCSCSHNFAITSARNSDAELATLLGDPAFRRRGFVGSCMVQCSMIIALYENCTTAEFLYHTPEEVDRFELEFRRFRLELLANPTVLEDSELDWWTTPGFVTKNAIKLLVEMANPLKARFKSKKVRARWHSTCSGRLPSVM